MSEMHIFTTEVKKEKRKMIRCYFYNLNLNFPFFCDCHFRTIRGMGFWPLVLIEMDGD